MLPKQIHGAGLFYYPPYYGVLEEDIATVKLRAVFDESLKKIGAVSFRLVNEIVCV